MKLDWVIEKEDIVIVNDFIAANKNIFVDIIQERNVERKNIDLSKDNIIHKMIMCLITSQQDSGPESIVSNFLRVKPFPLKYQTIKDSNYKAELIKETLRDNKLNRFINRIPNYFVANFTKLENTNWQLFEDLKPNMEKGFTKEKERQLANEIAKEFKGFGPKQSRNLIQALGITRYEVPIDSRITRWLNDKLNFPIPITPAALQIPEVYHLISDGFHQLCIEVDILPCLLDAAIFSSEDNGKWTRENFVY